MRPALICSSHTVSGVMPGDPAIARHSFDARMAALSATGFDGLCLHLRDHDLQRRSGHSDAGLRAVIEGHGLAVPSVEFLADWHEETVAAEAALDMALAAADAFGAGVINVGIDATGSGRPLASLAAPLGRLCRRAEAKGLRVALEFVAWGACARLEEAVALARPMQGTAGLLLDLWHLAWRGVPLADLASVPPEMVLGLQISDSPAPGGDARKATMDRLFPGEGVLDIAGFLGHAARAGWQAPVAVEVISPRAAALDVEICARLAYDTASRLVDRAWRPADVG